MTIQNIYDFSNIKKKNLPVLLPYFLYFNPYFTLTNNLCFSKCYFSTLFTNCTYPFYICTSSQFFLSSTRNKISLKRTHMFANYTRIVNEFVNYDIM